MTRSRFISQCCVLERVIQPLPVLARRGLRRQFAQVTRLLAIWAVVMPGIRMLQPCALFIYLMLAAVSMTFFLRTTAWG